jgi:2-amino-4-hydroxy-6-hydroxymethyldihydropteridine diphosphokinase
MSPAINQAVLLLGSNIAPLQNLPAILQALRTVYTLRSKSDVYESLPVGGEGGHYLNLAVEIECADTYAILRDHLKEIETSLGRIRSEDRNAPRTADIDIILFNHRIMDQKLLEMAFISIPVAQLYPDLIVPTPENNLASLASRLARSTWLHKVDISF